MEAVAKKVNNANSQDAFALATVAVARVKLLMEEFDGARKDLDTAYKTLEQLDSVDAAVNAAFYQTNADYYKVWQRSSPLPYMSLLSLAWHPC